MWRSWIRDHWTQIHPVVGRTLPMDYDACLHILSLSMLELRYSQGIIYDNEPKLQDLVFMDRNFSKIKIPCSGQSSQSLSQFPYHDVTRIIKWLALWAGRMNQMFLSRAGKMGPSCLIGIACCIPQENGVLYATWQILCCPSLFAQDGWILHSTFFWHVYGPKHSQDPQGLDCTLLTIRKCPHYAGGIWKRSFTSPVRPTVHTNLSWKRSFSKTLFKPEEFENASFSFSCGRKSFWKQSFSKTMTSR